MSNDSGEDIYWPSVMNSWDASIAIGQPPARISVRNLQTTIRVGTDAWGREGKVQPVLISATVSLRKPFDNASVRDTVNASTIHYGTLSKAILEAAQEFHDKGGKSTKLGELSTVKDLMNHIAGHLTDRSLSGRYLEFFGASVGRRDKPLLESSVVSSLELEVTLPKALLNSTTGVSRCSTAALNGIIGEILHNYAQEKLDGHYGISIVLRDLQVSTLIGVNSNERRAKQLVIANIEIDVWIMKQDVYNELEEIAVKTIEESSFQTLESLASHLAWRITRYLVQPCFVNYFRGLVDNDDKSRASPRIKICLSKPTAVTMADAPVVEILVDSRDMSVRAPHCSAALPFPLQGRLDEWIKKNDLLGLERDPVLGTWDSASMSSD